MQTIKQFIKRHNLVMTASRVSHNPNMENSKDMDHWHCTILPVKGPDKLVNGAGMSLPFSMGKGFNGKPPTLDTVLDCLASDAAGVEGPQTFEGWCQDYGYDADSRKAERTYNLCKKQLAQLQKLIGDKDEVNDLLFKTERL